MTSAATHHETDPVAMATPLKYQQASCKPGVFPFLLHNSPALKIDGDGRESSSTHTHTCVCVSPLQAFPLSATRGQEGHEAVSGVCQSRGYCRSTTRSNSACVHRFQSAFLALSPTYCELDGATRRFVPALLNPPSE